MRDIKKLIEQINETNDEKAFNDLIQTYYHEIYVFIYKQVLNKDQALDITQEIFIKVIVGIKKYNPKKSSFRTFLYKIANHYLIDQFRSKAYKNNRLLVMIKPDYKDSFDILENIILNEDIKELNYCIKKLPETYQEVLNLRFYASCTLKEISEILNTKISTVKYYLYQGIFQLKKWLEEGDFNEINK